MWYFIQIICCIGLVYSQNLNPIVTTNKGQIRGIATDNGYTKYVGVPYAVVNENNPFGASIPHPGFTEVFDAFDDLKRCPQVQNGVTMGSLDCLVLNIYVPNTASADNLLPILVWYHGGAFVIGKTDRETHDPNTFIDQDIIVIGVNYRLGIYGFMCLDIPEVPGNSGLKDQHLSLRWIYENIEAFGGDISKITIAGSSAGGMSVNLHLFSSYEKLYDKAIIQSGPALSYWMMVPSDATVPFRVAEYFGFSSTDIYEVLNFLATIDPDTLVVASATVQVTNAGGTNQPLTKPCVERTFEGVENFMADHPMNIDSEKVQSTPVIIGYNELEMAFQYALQNAEFFENYDVEMLFRLGFDMNNDLEKATDAARHFYVGDKIMSEEVRWELTDFGTDFIFGHPSQRMAQKLLDNGATAVYRYVFSYNGSFNFLDLPAATHGDELPYIFDEDTQENGFPKTEEDQIVIDRMSTMWGNFIKYGDPTPEITALLPVKWEPINRTSQPQLKIDLDLTMLDRPFNNRMAFWDLFYRIFAKYQLWYKEPNN